MGATVKAFNAITGLSMSEEQGWLFMAILKAVRSQHGSLHVDCYEDGAAYFALAGEAAISARSKTMDDDGWIEWRGGVCPVEGWVKVLVKLRSGVRSSEPEFSGLYSWENDGLMGDIIAYKVVTENSK